MERGKPEKVESGPLSNRTKELQAMSGQKPKVAVELLTGHPILRVLYV